MKLYLFPPSSRALGIVALKNHLALDCEIRPIDLGRGDQLTPEYIALNPNKKMPTLREFPEILRWYKGLATLTSWQQAVATKDAAMATWLSQRSS
jgi:hypothetical protein